MSWLQWRHQSWSYLDATKLAIRCVKNHPAHSTSPVYTTPHTWYAVFYRCGQIISLWWLTRQPIDRPTETAIETLRITYHKRIKLPWVFKEQSKRENSTSSHTILRYLQIWECTHLRSVHHLNATNWCNTSVLFSLWWDRILVIPGLALPISAFVI